MFEVFNLISWELLYFMLIPFGRNSYLCDPTTIQLLFEVSVALHDDLDCVNVKDDDNQPAHLISRFVHMVNNFKSMMMISPALGGVLCGFNISGLTLVAAPHC